MDMDPGSLFTIFSKHHLHCKLQQASCYILISPLFITDANNLIPMESALKIANKIKQNERFSMYIVIPMWPEGVPTGRITQQILFWQVGFL